MGHQCIGQVFGGRVVRAPGGVMHGKTSLVYHSDTSLLKVSITPAFSCSSPSLSLSITCDIFYSMFHRSDGGHVFTVHRNMCQNQPCSILACSHALVQRSVKSDESVNRGGLFMNRACQIPLRQQGITA